MGGFSFANVPRPRAPFRRRRRPLRPFFYCFRMAFVAGDNVHFIAFDLAFQNGRLLTINDALAEPHGHQVSLGDRQIQFRGDLPIRQVQP